jgi:hypothetical protein
MENYTAPKNPLQEPSEEWSKPELRVIMIKDHTLGSTAAGPDLGTLSGSTS